MNQVWILNILWCILFAPPQSRAFSFHDSKPFSRTMKLSSQSTGEETYHLSGEAPSIQSLVEKAKKLYDDTFNSSEISCTVAPGRVNLIGEHTDYTLGFVFPMAIGFSTACVGTCSIVKENEGECKIISVNSDEPKIISFKSCRDMKPLPNDHKDSWSNYVAGVVYEYIKLLPEKTAINMEISICGDVPLGSGLSSSAALEVAVATFLEVAIKKEFPTLDLGEKKDKALRCQSAENNFCDSPCGIMDQYVSCCASKDNAVLIDCRSLDFESVRMAETSDEKPVFVICNSNVKHSIGGGEYPVRVKQCAEATKVLQSLCGDRIKTLRDATLEDVEQAHKKRKDEGPALMDDLIYKRAKHVVSENKRTLDAKKALTSGDWKLFGALMNESHESMRSDYEVSCDEIDFLVETAQKFEGVYGSRLTGGGFGGCTVTLVDKSRVKDLCEHLKKEYAAKYDNSCPCFESSPGVGAREIQLS